MYTGIGFVISGRLSDRISSCEGKIGKIISIDSAILSCQISFYKYR